jgi:hypothetical protein
MSLRSVCYGAGGDACACVEDGPQETIIVINSIQSPLEEPNGFVLCCPVLSYIGMLSSGYRIAKDLQVNSREMLLAVSNVGV